MVLLGNRVEFCFMFLVLAFTIVIAGGFSTSPDVGNATSSPVARQDPLTHSIQTQATENLHQGFGKLVVMVTTNQKKYFPGQVVYFTILLTNRGKHPVTLNFDSTCRSTFAIEAANGTLLLFQFLPACLLVPARLAIMPGETLEMGSFNWNQVIWLGSSARDGTYIIRGEILSTPPMSGISRIRLDPNHDHDENNPSGLELLSVPSDSPISKNTT